MKKQKSIKVNFIMNALLTMSSFLFPLISFPYVSRVLLPAGTGKAAFAVSVVTYFSMFAQLGIPVYGIKACAKVRDDKKELSKTVQEIFIINLITCMIAYAAFGISLFTVPRIEADRTLFLLVSLLIPFNMLGMEWLYQGLEQYSYITVRSIIFKGLAMVATLCLVRSSEDYVIYGFLMIFASSASGLCNFINLRRIISLKPTGSYHIKRHIRPILVFFAMSCALTVYTSLCEMLLGFMSTDRQVGYYHAAARIKGILVSIVTALGDVLLPRAVYYVEKDMKKEFEDIVRKAMHFVCIVAPCAIIYMILYAEEGVIFILGDAYGGTVLPLQIIMPTLLLAGISGVTGNQILIPQGKEKCVLYSEIGGATVNLIINFMLIPHLGAVGAAIATLIAEIVVLFIQYQYIRALHIACFQDVRILSILFAVLAGTATSVWVGVLDIGIFWKLLLSGLLFFCTYGGALILTKDSIVLESITLLRKRQ